LKIVVLDGYALNPGDLSWEALRQFGSVNVYDRTPEDQIPIRARGADAILTNKSPLSAQTLAQLPGLRYIGVLATGFNIVNIDKANELGITVTNIPAYGTASVAQFAIALLLELCHHIGLHSEAVRQGEWSRCADWCFWKTPLIELAGKTLGIVGFGRIGRQTGAIAAGMGMRIIANSGKPREVSNPNLRLVPLDELLRQADVVSLHCPLSLENKGMMHMQRFQQMKSTALLVNTSRGALIVDRDLADALNSGIIAGAALDVLSLEPPLGSNPLLTARNCIVTPHIAWATREARARLMDCAVENLKGFLEGTVRNLAGQL